MKFINLIGIFLSFVYFFGLLVISRHMSRLTLEGKRKFVHIMLGNWWFMVLAFFDQVLCAAIVPASFIVINYVSLKRNHKGGLLSELERKEEKNPSYGIVLYPVSMVILVFLSFEVFHDPRAGGIGMLALSYGDGFAALAGKKFDYIPFTVWGNKKTISGSTAMFLATAGSVGIYLYITGLQSNIPRAMALAVIVALAAALAELLSPFGTDNLTIPVSALFLYAKIA